MVLRNHLYRMFCSCTTKATTKYPNQTQKWCYGICIFVTHEWCYGKNRATLWEALRNLRSYYTGSTMESTELFYKGRYRIGYQMHYRMALQIGHYSQRFEFMTPSWFLMMWREARITGGNLEEAFDLGGQLALEKNVPNLEYIPFNCC